MDKYIIRSLVYFFREMRAFLSFTFNVLHLLALYIYRYFLYAYRTFLYFKLFLLHTQKYLMELYKRIYIWLHK